MIKLTDLIVEDVSKTTKKERPYVSGDTYVSREEAKRFYDYGKYDFDFEQFYNGMLTELKHQDVTGGSLMLTGKIVASHLKEVPNYYTLLKKYVEK